MSVIPLILAAIAVAIALFGLWVLSGLTDAVKALLESAREAQHRRHQALVEPDPAARAERLARARGHIAACKGAELALAGHEDDLHASLALAHYRAQAAYAQAELRVLGVDA
jgi:hypothetical protein